MSAQFQNFSGGIAETLPMFLGQARRPPGSRLPIFALLMPGGLQSGTRHGGSKVSMLTCAT
jgi:hypothetical protein